MSNLNYEFIPKEITKPTVIIVEGKDDEQFIESLLKDSKVRNYQIVRLNGKGNFNVRFMSALTKLSGFDTVKNIAIVLDADERVENSFKKVRTVLKRLNLPIPVKPGEITNDNKHRIGVFLFPDCETPGSIEDLIMRSLNEEARKCIDKYIKCMKLHSGAKSISKSILYSYIAVQNEPSKDLTTAIKRNQINIKDDVFDKIKSFLKSLA